MDVLTEEEVTNFKELAIGYFNIDDQIKQEESKVKELKKTRKEYTEKILDFMRDNSIDDLKTEKGKLKYTINHTKSGLSKKTLRMKLLEFFSENTDKADELFKHLDNREIKERVTLKLVKNK